VVRRVALADDQWTSYLGLRVESERDALVDSLVWLPPEAADALFAWALARGLADASLSPAAVAARRRRKGSPRLACYARMAAAGAGSFVESRFHLALTRRHVTGWKANVRIVLPDGTWARPDALFEGAMLVVEIDGLAAHRSKEALQRDLARQNALVAAGYKVLRFTWQDVVERVDHCVDQVLRQLPA
jgi:very-short-patch-repair endonuclease